MEKSASPMGDAAAGHRPIDFPPFRLDLASERLLRAGKVIPIRRKAWSVLRHLVEHRGFLVTREELLDTVWKDVVVGDDNLTQSIAEVRRALGDTARRPRFVETVHGRGFRFLGRVEEGVAAEAAPAATPPAAPFVGRDSELRNAASVLAEVESGRRRVLLVTGEAGIGKTRFVEMLLGRVLADHPGARWAIGQCFERFGGREPYMPVLEALDRLMRHDAKLVRPVLRRLAPTWRAELQSVKKPKARGAAVTQERVLREIALALEEIACDRLLLLVLEDLHWSDPSTIDFVSFVAQRVEPARLLIIGTERPAEAAASDHPVARAKGLLESRGFAVEVPLEDLSHEAVADYVAARFPELRSGQSLADWLYRGSEGNALFMVSLADTVEAAGAIRAPRAKRRSTIPQNLRAMIRSTLASLDRASRRVLDAASVAGLHFDAHAVAAALDLPVTDIEAACEELVRKRGLLGRLDAREWPDGSIGGRYAFRHSLYREVLYDELSPALRRDLHGRIGRRLEAGYRERTAEIDADLALHFEGAGDRPRAIHYLESTAARALRRAAFREANQSLESALDLLAETRDLPDRARRELELLRSRAVALLSLVGHFGIELEPVLVRMRAIASVLGNRACEFEVAVALWFFSGARGQAEETREQVRVLAELGRELGEGFRLIADAALGVTAYMGGDPAAACSALERVAAADPHVVNEVSKVVRYGPDPLAFGSIMLAHALWLLGRADRAREMENEALARAEELDLPFTLATVLMESSLLRFLCGDMESAEARAERAAALASGHDLFWKSMAAVVCAAARIRRGAEARGLPLGRRALEELVEKGGAGMATPFLMIGLDACLEAGEVERGLDMAQWAFDSLQATDRVFAAEIWRLKGELLLASAAAGMPQGKETRTEEARSCFERAVEIAKQQGSPSLELRATLSLARLARRSGAGGEERQRLAKLVARFTEGRDTADLIEAKRLLP